MNQYLKCALKIFDKSVFTLSQNNNVKAIQRFIPYGKSDSSDISGTPWSTSPVEENEYEYEYEYDCVEQTKLIQIKSKNLTVRLNTPPKVTKNGFAPKCPTKLLEMLVH